MLRQAGVSGHAYPVGVHQPRLLVHPRPRSLLPRLQLFNFNIKREENKRKYPRKFLCVSLRSDTPPFSLVSFSGFGRRETDKPSLGLSPSWFRWNLIWIAAFGFGHSCSATVGKKKRDWTLKAPNLIKSGARWAPFTKSSDRPESLTRQNAPSSQLAGEAFGHKVSSNCYCFAYVW